MRVGVVNPETDPTPESRVTKKPPCLQQRPRKQTEGFGGLYFGDQSIPQRAAEGCWDSAISSPAVPQPHIPRSKPLLSREAASPAAKQPHSRSSGGKQCAFTLLSKKGRQRIRRMRSSALQCFFLQCWLLQTASKHCSSLQSVYAKTALPYSAALPLVYSQRCPDLPTDSTDFTSFPFFFPHLLNQPQRASRAVGNE